MDYARERPTYVAAHRADLLEVLAEQAQVVKSIWEQSGSLAVAAIFDPLRWDKALADRLFVRMRVTATHFGEAIAAALGGTLTPGDLDAYLLNSSRIGASNINAKTEDHLQVALTTDEADRSSSLDDVFDQLVGSRLARLAASTVTTSANFGMSKAAEASERKNKSWQVNSSNPRPEHAQMDGESVPIGELFSNGMQWPGDPAGGADNDANCECSLGFD